MPFGIKYEYIHSQFLCDANTPRTCSLTFPPVTTVTEWLQLWADKTTYVNFNYMPATESWASPSGGMLLSGGVPSYIYPAHVSTITAYATANSTLSCLYAARTIDS